MRGEKSPAGGPEDDERHRRRTAGERRQHARHRLARLRLAFETIYRGAACLREIGAGVLVAGIEEERPLEVKRSEAALSLPQIRRAEVRLQFRARHAFFQERLVRAGGARQVPGEIGRVRLVEQARRARPGARTAYRARLDVRSLASRRDVRGEPERIGSLAERSRRDEEEGGADPLQGVPSFLGRSSSPRMRSASASSTRCDCSSSAPGAKRLSSQRSSAARRARTVDAAWPRSFSAAASSSRVMPAATIPCLSARYPVSPRATSAWNSGAPRTASALLSRAWAAVRARLIRSSRGSFQKSLRARPLAARTAIAKGPAASAGQNQPCDHGGAPIEVSRSRKRMGLRPPAARRFCAGKATLAAVPGSAAWTSSRTGSVRTVRYAFWAGSKMSIDREGMVRSPVRSGTRSCSTVRVPLSWPCSTVSLSLVVASYARNPGTWPRRGSRRSRTLPRPWATSLNVTGWPTETVSGSTEVPSVQLPTLPTSNPAGRPAVGSGCTSMTMVCDARCTLAREKSIPNPVSTSTSAGSISSLPARSGNRARLRRRNER